MRGLEVHPSRLGGKCRKVGVAVEAVQSGAPLHDVEVDTARGVPSGVCLLHVGEGWEEIAHQSANRYRSRRRRRGENVTSHAKVHLRIRRIGGVPCAFSAHDTQGHIGTDGEEAMQSIVEGKGESGGVFALHVHEGVGGGDDLHGSALHHDANTNEVLGGGRNGGKVERQGVVQVFFFQRTKTAV